MSQAHAIVLAERGVVEVAGADAAAFLQGLITNDIAKVGERRAVYAALLTPQGKVVYDFLIFAAPGGFHLDCVGAFAADLAVRLTKYKLRAKVKIADRSDELAVVAFDPGAEAPGAVPDPRLAALGQCKIVPRAQAGEARRQEYEQRRLRLGVPDAAVDIPPETLFPLDCNFEELNGVDFAKGCYVGQELTARMKHRASARKRMLPVSATLTLPPTGTAIKLGDTEIGEMRGTEGMVGMALIRLDRLGDAMSATADGVTVKIGRPSYPLIVAKEETS